MDFKTKTQSQTSFNCSMETAGAIVPVSSQAPSVEDWEDPLTKGVDCMEDGAEELIANRLAAQWLEPNGKEVEAAIKEFDETYPAIAETIREREVFLAKRNRVISGIKGQIKIAAASLMATAVVISGIGFVSRSVSEFQLEQERQELQAKQEAEALREAGKQWVIQILNHKSLESGHAQDFLDIIKTDPEVKAEGYRYAQWLYADQNISLDDIEMIEELANF